MLFFPPSWKEKRGKKKGKEHESSSKDITVYCIPPITAALALLKLNSLENVFKQRIFFTLPFLTPYSVSILKFLWLRAGNNCNWFAYFLSFLFLKLWENDNTFTGTLETTELSYIYTIYYNYFAVDKLRFLVGVSISDSQKLVECIDRKVEGYAAAAKSLQSCPTLCDPMDSSPPGSSVHRILQAKILEWVAISFSKKAMVDHFLLQEGYSRPIIYVSCKRQHKKIKDDPTQNNVLMISPGDL